MTCEDGCDGTLHVSGWGGISGPRRDIHSGLGQRGAEEPDADNDECQRYTSSAAMPAGTVCGCAKPSLLTRVRVHRSPNVTTVDDR
jgi:hypothetical protein